jgi:hypothetical protein
MNSFLKKVLSGNLFTIFSVTVFRTEDAPINL